MPSNPEPTAAEKAVRKALADTVNGHERGAGNVEVWTPADFADETRAVVAAVRSPLYREAAEVDRLRAENTAMAATLDQFRSFPDNPGPGNWSTSYRMGYAEAARDVRAIAAALGLDQDGEP